MKRRSRVFAMPFLALLVMALILVPSVFAGSQDINAKIKAGNYVQKAENFLILFDKSGSMNDWYGPFQKFEQEKILVSLFNNTVPDLKLSAGLRDFGENYANFNVTNLDYGMTAYDRQALGKVIAGLRAPMGKTPLAEAIAAGGKDLQGSQGNIALVIFSDGMDMDEAPVKAAAAVKGQFGDRICIYTVQLGNSLPGGKLLERIAKAGQCGVSVKGDDVKSDAGMTSFVETIFLAAKPQEKPAPAAAPVEKEKKAPAAAAAPAPKLPKKVTITLDVKFETGKAVVRPIFQWEVQKLAEFLKQYPDTNVTIEGHTDNVGKEAANVKLSQARADAIAKILVDKYGIDKSRIKTVGYGPNKPVASNDTAEGKRLNRRTEAQVEAIEK